MTKLKAGNVIEVINRNGAMDEYLLISTYNLEVNREMFYVIYPESGNMSTIGCNTIQDLLNSLFKGRAIIKSNKTKYEFKMDYVESLINRIVGVDPIFEAKNILDNLSIAINKDETLSNEKYLDLANRIGMARELLEIKEERHLNMDKELAGFFFIKIGRAHV